MRAAPRSERGAAAREAFEASVDSLRSDLAPSSGQRDDQIAGCERAPDPRPDFPELRGLRFSTGANPHPGIYSVTIGSGHQAFQVRQRTNNGVTKTTLARRVGPSYLRFAYLEGGCVFVWRKERGALVGDRAALAALRAFLADPDPALREKHCLRCGRVLSDPASKRAGLGPECRNPRTRRRKEGA